MVDAPDDVAKMVERLSAPGTWARHRDNLVASSAAETLVRDDAPFEAAALIQSLSSQLAEVQAEIVAAWNAFGGQIAEDYEDTRYVADAADGDLAEQIRELTRQRNSAEAERDRLAAAAVAILEAIDSELDTDERSAAFLGRVSRLRAALDTANGAEK